MQARTPIISASTTEVWWLEEIKGFTCRGVSRDGIAKKMRCQANSPPAPEGSDEVVQYQKLLEENYPLAFASELAEQVA